MVSLGSCDWVVALVANYTFQQFVSKVVREICRLWCVGRGPVAREI